MPLSTFPEPKGPIFPLTLPVTFSLFSLFANLSATCSSLGKNNSTCLILGRCFRIQFRSFVITCTTLFGNLRFSDLNLLFGPWTRLQTKGACAFKVLAAKLRSPSPPGFMFCGHHWHFLKPAQGQILEAFPFSFCLILVLPLALALLLITLLSNVPHLLCSSDVFFLPRSILSVNYWHISKSCTHFHIPWCHLITAFHHRCGELRSGAAFCHSSWHIAWSKKGTIIFSPEENIRYIYIYLLAFLIAKSQKWREEFILKKRSISTGLPSRTFGTSSYFQDSLYSDKGDAPKPPMTPESISDSAAYRDAWDGSHEEEWEGERASGKIPSHPLSLPVEVFSSAASGNYPPTHF